METQKLNHRYIARVVLDAETPLFVGSGESSLLKDALVQKDNHGFPMIQGTSLTGVLRHALEDNGTDKEKWNSFFGYQGDGKKGLGSQLKVSSAYLVLNDGKIAEGLQIYKGQKELAKQFDNLPNRQHVRITHKGVAKGHGLFDNEVVYKGARFLFELELKGSYKDSEKWNELLSELQSQSFRVGQGTRNGYGRLSVHSIKVKDFDLEKENDFDLYLNFDPSLNGDDSVLEEKKLEEKTKSYIHFKLELKPDDFFSFSAGFGDDEVDNIPVTESVIEYIDNELTIKNGLTLIPTSSVKGALRHRTAFHYNKLKKKFVDNISDEVYLNFLETNNDAVYNLFGAEEGVDDRDPKNENGMYAERKGFRGKVVINDILLSKEKVANNKIFNHVAIDRFTGGAMDGALFSEKVSYFNDKNGVFEFDVYVEPIEEGSDEKIMEAFENALTDICKGLLPLGGMTTKGHGMFTGNLIKNKENIYSYE